MRFHPLAVATVLALTGGGLVVAAPAGADSSVLYVSDYAAASCSDTGPGTAAAPFCTIQAAADVAQPGQTVDIAPGYYTGSLDITRSGTPGAPITFTAEPGQGPGDVNVDLGTDDAFTVTGAHDVTVSGFQVDPEGPDGALSVSDSSDITLRDDWFADLGTQSSTGAAAVSLGGNTSDVTLTRSRVGQKSGAAVSIGSGVSGTTLSSDLLQTTGAPAVAATDAPGTAVTGDTVADPCGDAVDLAGASTGSTVENDIITAQGSSGAACAGAGADTAQTVVDAEATAGTTVDYNLVQPPTALPGYSWAGADYADPAALLGGSGQGAHDLDADPGLNAEFVPQEGSPAIDSADANAPGETALDLDGHPRVDDPLVPDTGTGPGGGAGYYDRGAIEFQDPLHLALTVGPSQGPAPLDVTATVGLSNPWGTAVSSYTFDFGDGSAPVTTTSPSATHVYTAPAPGTGYTVRVTATTPDGSRSTTTGADVTKPGPLTPRLTVTRSPSTPLTVTADSSGSTDPWPITAVRTDFGDGTAPAAGLGANAHTYASPGQYTVTLTETDSSGATVSTSRQVTIGSAYVPAGPVRVLDTRDGTGAAAGIVPAGGTVRLKVTGVNGVPTSGVTAVVLNLTATGATGTGFTTVHPGGSAAPNASNLDYTRGQTLSNQVTVPVAADGSIALTASGGASVQLVADLEGYYQTNSSPADGVYTPLQPVRLLDTRGRNGVHTGPLGPGQTVALPVGAYSGNAVTAGEFAVLRVTVTAPTASGYVTAYPGGQGRPGTSTVNFAPGQTVSNLVVTPLGPDGAVDLYNHAGDTDVVVDLVGAFATAAATGGANGDPYTPVSPTRILDTRALPGGTPLGAGGSLNLKVAGTASVPADATAVLVNLTATGTTAPGFLTAYATGAGLPATSTLNTAPGSDTTTLALVPVGANGTITVCNHSGTTQVVADLEGYYAP